MAQASESRIMALLFFGVLMGALDLAIVGGAAAVRQVTRQPSPFWPWLPAACLYWRWV